MANIELYITVGILLIGQVEAHKLIGRMQMVQHIKAKGLGYGRILLKLELLA